MTLNIFMDNVETQLKSRVDSFVAELSDLVRKAAIEAVQGALKGGAAAAPGVAKAAGKKRGPAPAAAPVAAPKAAAKAPKAAAAPAASKRKAGQKRSPDEIVKTTEKLLGSDPLLRPILKNFEFAKDNEGFYGVGLTGNILHPRPTPRRR